MTPEQLDLLQGCQVSSIYLMGGSFALGSLFTVLILIGLEFVRRKNDKPF